MQELLSERSIGEAQMIRMSKRAVLTLIFVVNGLCLAQEVWATPTAHLFLESEPGDYIGQGLNFDITYTPSNSAFFFPQIRRTIGSPGEPAELLFVLGTVTGGLDNTFALLFFGTDGLGIPMQPGFFPDAERADFASPGHPGLDISFQNRGCNTLTGDFTVHDVAFSSAAAVATGSSIERFAASFEQHCEGFSPALLGTFSYQAFAVPEPGSLVLLAWLLPLLPLWARRRRGA